MAEEKMMTEAEFVTALRTWTSGVYFRSRAALLQTHGSGRLRRELERYVDAFRRGDGYKISFRFPRYGVFRHYGAGRGWKIANGRPIRERRILSLREIAGKKRNDRTPLDWLDGYIASGTGKLADTAAEYYGDMAFRNVLKEIDKARIVR